MTNAIVTWLVKGFFSAMPHNPSAKHLRWKWFIRVLVGLETWAEHGLGWQISLVLSMVSENWQPVHAPESSKSLGAVGIFWVSSCEFSMVLRQLLMDEVINHTQTCVFKDMDFQAISGCTGWSMICWKYWTMIYHDSWWNLRTIMHQ